VLALVLALALMIRSRSSPMLTLIAAENALITRLQNVSGATGTQMQVLKTRARRFENEADALERRVAALELAVEEEREYGHGHGHEQGKNDHKYEPDGQQEVDQPESPEEANTDTRPSVPAPERPCRCHLCQMYGHHGRPYAFDGDYEEYMTRTRPDA
jgi:hypothetical protein